MKPLKKIDKIIKKHKKIIMMTHSHPDLDGFSAILFFNDILQNMKKECYVLMNNNNLDISITKTLKLINDNNKLNFINEEDYNNLIDNETLVIIFDVHKKNLLDFPNIINKTKKIIIIDHHIISKDIINETIFNFINTNYSSVSEIIVDYAICNNYKINSIIATTLLAGIEIDTNNYNLNTKEGTFKACAHLLKSGADIILKQEILKENKDLYIKKQYFIKRSYMINNEMALCVLDHHIYDSKFLAILSDELLQFENVEVSFTIGYIGRKKVGISARSIGKFDVEKIMNQFNGGGHATNAACQIENSSIEKVKRMLLKNIKER